MEIPAEKNEPAIFCGLRVVLSERLVTYRGVVETQRTWGARLFTRPWRPWRATKFTPVWEPSPTGTITDDGRLLIHPATYAEMRRVLALRETSPDVIGRA